MLILDAERRTRQSIQDSYDALSVELLGARASGLPPERIRELIASGLLPIESLEGLNVNSLDEPLNPLLFIRRIGPQYSRASARERRQMRGWTISQWRRELKGLERSKIPSAIVPIMDRPEALETAQAPIRLPELFGPADQASLVSAHESVGAFIRGLGARFADEASAIFFEEWNGEELLNTPDPVRRDQMLQVIREEVGTAVLTKDSAQEVARRIRQRSGDLARNFERIAETELQAVHNEGQILQAVEIDGENAKVARIPETTACQYCLNAFLNAEGKPLVFNVTELIANGSNVGRKRRDWKPTCYPMHPNCRCDTIPVSENQTVSRTGEVLREDVY